MWLKLRLFLIMTLMFGIIYGLVIFAMGMLGLGGLGSFYFYAILASVMMFIQYMIGPKMVEWSMSVRYVNEQESPALHRMVAELARDARIPKPRIGIAKTNLPNAFAFGRWASDGRVCVTEGIMSLLDEKELKGAPEGTVVKKPIGKQLEGLNFHIQVSVLDCTGCGNCVDVCPAKIKALEMKPLPN